MGVEIRCSTESVNPDGTSTCGPRLFPSMSTAHQFQSVMPGSVRQGRRPAGVPSVLPKGTWSQMEAAFRRLEAAGRMADSQVSRRARIAGARANAARKRMGSRA